ncbi:MAG: hypothetical protein RLZZ611_2165 [Cyanobacteriota bacterium]|jgi:hypothetical protein
MQALDLDLASGTPVNHLWGELVERLGLERSTRAARQALDLQAMRGNPGTVPLLLVETCGVGLVERVELRAATGLPVPEQNAVVLLFSRRQGALQLLCVQA